MKFKLLLNRKPKTQDVVSIRGIVENLQKSSLYFKRQAEEKPALFLPEYNISQEILNLIGTGDGLEENDLQDIVNAYNKITAIEHYDGSGWFNFQVILNSLFLEYGYKGQWDKSSSSMSFVKL